MTEDERKAIILGLVPRGAVFLRRKSGGVLWRPRAADYVVESNVWLAGLYDPATVEKDYGPGKSEHSHMIEAAERLAAWGAPDGTVVALLVDEIVRLREANDLLRARSQGVELISAERNRQLSEWDGEHDDEHEDGQLAVRAAELAILHTDEGITDFTHEHDEWGLVAKHGHDSVRSLTIAGALIAAEIDRLLRIDEGREDG
jgi:hypothetical protein